MKVFIFGAGASQASQQPPRGSNVTSPRAPLVDQLFEPQYGDCARNILSDEDFQEARLATQSIGSLEKWLTQRWKQIQSLKQDITKTSERAFFGRICFYLWNLLQRVSTTYNSLNGYDLFTKKLKDRDEPFGLISFNYDTLLDRAVKYRFGVPLISLNDYFRIPLIKPHGSVNWLSPKRDTDSVTYVRASFDLPGLLSQASNQIFNGGPLNFGNVQVLYPDDPELSDIQRLSDPRFGKQYFYPLILLPLTVKQYDFLVGFNERIISEGKKILSTASEIYLIGYRAADDVIKEMFAEVKAGTTLHVVSLADSNEIMNRVLDWYPGNLTATASSRGFWDFLETF
jgi:hypothetical protein